MTASIRFSRNEASAEQLAEFLLVCDENFSPYLSSRVEIGPYARKIVSAATRCEAWSDRSLVGLGAIYCNDFKARVAYITNVSVIAAWMGKGIATTLVEQCVECARSASMRQVKLEVARENLAAIGLYEKAGFRIARCEASFLTMTQYFCE